jgi:hypothetical protein
MDNSASIRGHCPGERNLSVSGPVCASRLRRRTHHTTGGPPQIRTVQAVGRPSRQRRGYVVRSGEWGGRTPGPLLSPWEFTQTKSLPVVRGWLIDGSRYGRNGQNLGPVSSAWFSQQTKPDSGYFVNQDESVLSLVVEGSQARKSVDRQKGGNLSSDLMMNALPNQPGDLKGDEAEPQGERCLPQREPGTMPEQEPGNTWGTPEAERLAQREEGTVLDPDLPPLLTGSSLGM